MKNKLALFDLDGTLFNTYDVNYYSYKEALNELGYELDYDYYCTNCNGRLYKQFLPELTDGKEETMEKIHKIKKAAYSKNLDKAKVNAGLFDIALALKTEYYLGVVTTASKSNTIEILSYFDKLKLFDLVLTHEDITEVKPSPEGYNKAMTHFNIGPENTIIFEDAPAGVEAGLASKASVFVIKNF